MKFTKDEKMVFVKRYQDGETVISICSENQIPRSTFYRWIQDYQQTITDTGTVPMPLRTSTTIPLTGCPEFSMKFEPRHN